MKCWELTGLGYENLRLGERETPAAGPGEVAVRILAAGLNSRNHQIVHGIYRMVRLPIIPIADYCGVVEEVGAGVDPSVVGSRVIGIVAQEWHDGPFDPAKAMTTLGADRDGVMRERIVVHENAIVPAPSHLSDEEAAGLSAAGVSAWNATIDVGRPRPGDNVLVQGLGGVATFAIQFARAAGARVVVTTRSPAKREYASSLGAHEVIDINEHPEWQEQVRVGTGGVGVDLVVELYGELERSIGALRPGGTIAQVGYMSNLIMSAPVIPMMLSNVNLRGVVVGSGAQVRAMCQAIELHRLHPPIARTFEFDELPAALDHVETGDVMGKVIVRF